MKTEFELESEKSPEQIEREIDAQRESIGNIVDALESKFTPGQMFDQALGMMQSNGTTFLTNLGTSVRNNPVPAVLTSVGLLWLMMSQNRPPVARPSYRVGPDQDRMGEWADGLSDSVDSARDRMHQTAGSLKGGFESVKGSYQNVKGKAAHMADNLGSAKDNLSHTAHDVSDRVVRSTQAMGSQFNQLLKEQPLVVAAAGIAIGALLGAALPSTSTEQRYMGKTSAGLADKVKKQAREGVEAVRDTVTKTTDHAGADTQSGGESRTAGTTTDTTTNTTTSSTSTDSSTDLSRGLGTS